MVNPDTLIPVIILALMGRVVIYDAHEDFLHRLKLFSVVPAVLRVPFAWGIAALEWIVGRLCRRMIVTQSHLTKRYGRKALLVDNSPLTQGPVVEKSLNIVSRPLPVDHRILGYAAIIKEDRLPSLMLQVALELNKFTPTRLRLVGRFMPAHFRDEIVNDDAGDLVDFLGMVPHWRALAEIRNFDIGLCLLKRVADIPNTGVTKLYEYMQLGVPFIASNFEYWERSLEGMQAGLFLPPEENPEKIAKAIYELWMDKERYKRYLEAGKAFIKDTYNWEKRSEPYRKLLLEIKAEWEAKNTCRE